MDSSLSEIRQLLTSTEAAEFLGASPTSIKRWADEGLLPCVKTAGKHRRFALDDLQRFRQERMGAPPPEDPGGPNTVEAWLTDLVVGRPYRLQARLFEARSQLGSWSAVCSRLGPVITAMGEAWERGELSVVEEHLASERLSRALNAVGETLRVADDAPRALLMTVESEEHTLGLSLLELALRELGWDPIWCGRKTPIEAVPDVLDTQEIRMLAVSGSVHASDPRTMAQHAEALSDMCKSRGTLLLFGGRAAWPDPPSYGLRLYGFERLASVVPSPSAIKR